MQLKSSKQALPVRAKEEEKTSRRPQKAGKRGLGTKYEAEAGREDARLPGQKAHILFDEEGNDVDGPAEIEATADNAGDDAVMEKEPSAAEEEDSEDDAPEAIGTGEAAAELKRAARQVQRAAQEHAATQKRKRKHRDEFFKKQAEARQVAAAQSTDFDGDIDTSPAKDSAPPLAGLGAMAFAKDDDHYEGMGSRRKRHRAKKAGEDDDAEEMVAVEDLKWPILSDGEDEEEEEERAGEGVREERAAKRRRRGVEDVQRLMRKVDKRLKERRAGGTTFRVLRNGRDKRLAPVVDKSALRRKEMLMRRKKAVVKRGFFAKKAGGL